MDRTRRSILLSALSVALLALALLIVLFARSSLTTSTPKDATDGRIKRLGQYPFSPYVSIVRTLGTGDALYVCVARARSHADTPGEMEPIKDPREFIRLAHVADVYKYNLRRRELSKATGEDFSGGAGEDTRRAVRQLYDAGRATINSPVRELELINATRSRIKFTAQGYIQAIYGVFTTGDSVETYRPLATPVVALRTRESSKIAHSPDGAFLEFGGAEAWEFFRADNGASMGEPFVLPISPGSGEHIQHSYLAGCATSDGHIWIACIGGDCYLIDLRDSSSN